MASADCLVLLSDVDGLYAADPNRDPAAEFVPEVHAITARIEAMAGGSASDVGSGGMATKIAAARIAMDAGCHLCIASGHPLHPLKRVEDGARCTWFIAAATPGTARKQWIAGALKAAGILTIDAGAVGALRRGRSLLPAGITAVAGNFERGDAVDVVDPLGVVVARGLSAYSSTDVARIQGRRSGEIEQLVGFRGRDEVVHRDDLVLRAHAQETGTAGQ
jgi:glutamate 5-kinase